MQFDLQTSDDFSATFYDSLKQYTEETIKASKESFAMGFGVGLGPIGIQGGFATPKSEVYKQIHRSSESQDSKIVKISSEVVAAKFILKGDNLMLDDYFEDSIRRLPKKYDSKSYFDFFRVYGTHFVQAGALGGRYEYYYVYSDSQYKEMSTSVHSFQDCIKAGVRASIIYAHIGANYYECEGGSDSSGTATSITNKALHKVINIEGKRQ
jgi:complement component 6